MRRTRRATRDTPRTLAGAVFVVCVGFTVAVAVAAPATEARPRPDRVRMLVDASRRAGSAAERETIANAVVTAGPDASAALLKQARAELARQHKDYIGRFQQRAAARHKERPVRGRMAAEVEDLRKTIRDVAAAEPLTKEMIETRSDPALARLEALLAVTPADVLDGRPPLVAERAELSSLGDVMHRCAVLQATTPRRGVEPDRDAASFGAELVLAEELACLLAAPLAPADRQTVLANAALVRELDPEEGRGAMRLNAIRILVGLPAQIIDPKLVAACRHHSRDMAERGFFAHESPASGRETPWKRATAAGTSANAENIFSGAGDGRAAIEGWWHSPGHHKNMLGPQSRTGLGRWKDFWTQLFG